MRELRKDPVSGRWVILASDRAKRPLDYRVADEHPRPAICPFCPGNEQRTPPEVLAYRPSGGPASRPNSPGWSLRVFPNRHPALMIEGELDPDGDGLYDRMNGIGAHEMVVETPEHDLRLHQLDEAGVERVLMAWRDRILDLRRDRRFRYVMVFKNHGGGPDASVPHSHSQLIALPVVPRAVADELHGSLEYYRFRERCVFCDMAKQEVSQRVRMVHESPEIVCFEPFAPRFPFETWLMPRGHRAAYEESSPQELASMAGALRTTLHKLMHALDDAPYTLVLHTAPLDEHQSRHYHWHLEILPMTLAQLGGFELGSGFYINPTPPEEAAQFLRDLEVP